MRRTILLSFFFLFFYPLVKSSAGERILLRWKMEKGKEYLYKLVTTSESAFQGMKTVDAGGMKASTEFKILYKVLDVDKDGTLTTEALYKEALMKMKMGDREFLFSSKDKSMMENPLYAWLKEIVNKRFIVKMDSRGNIIETEGIEELFDAVKKSLPPESQKSAPDVDEFKSLLKNAWIGFPEKPVGIGDSWSYSLTIPIKEMGKVQTDYRYKLAGIEEFRGERCAKIDTEIDIKMEIGKIKGVSGFNMKIRGSTGHGKMYFSLERNILLLSSIDLIFDMVMETTVGSGELKEVSVQTRQNMKMELLD